MEKYHKIQSVYKRDPETKMKTFLYGVYSTPEIEYLANNTWVFTEKIDGTNIRIGWRWNGDQVLIGGRTNNAQIPTFLLTRLNELFSAGKLDHAFPLNEEEGSNPITLYGEGYGAKIQKGGGLYKPDGVDFILFDVRVGSWWLRRDDVEDVAADLGCGVVPIVDIGTLAEAEEIVRRGFPSSIGSRDAEGLVMRPIVEMLTRGGHRVIAKLKTRDFVD